MTVGGRSAQSPEGPPVLLVEDEPNLGEEIRLELQANGHPVRLAMTAADRLAVARSGWASAFVFDRMSQDNDGLSAIETEADWSRNGAPRLVSVVAFRT